MNERTLTRVHRGSVDLPGVVLKIVDPNRVTNDVTLGLDAVIVGSGDGCDVVVADPAVSRTHVSLRLTGDGIVVRDLDSKNGTWFREARVHAAVLPLGATLRLGGSEISAVDSGGSASVPLSLGVRFGQAIGASLAMRALFARLERLASADETVLLTGESGTGKELLARALHESGRRRAGAFGILDCASLAANLIEAELFGHARGAFTGATNSREGVFELASGGTVFIDEIGELPLELQGKLLRVLEQRSVRRLGENEWRPVDVRVVAATHRNLRAMVKQGLFREDLYYRLAVVNLRVPSLRERPEDVALLVERFLAEYHPPRSVENLPPNALQWLTSHDWPGNVRELRNAVARMVLFPDESPVLDVEGGVEKGTDNTDPWARLPLREARELIVESFERRYLTARLSEHAGNVSKTAAQIGVSRQFLHRLMKQYGLGSPEDTND